MKQIFWEREEWIPQLESQRSKSLCHSFKVWATGELSIYWSSVQQTENKTSVLRRKATRRKTPKPVETFKNCSFESQPEPVDSKLASLSKQKLKLPFSMHRVNPNLLPGRYTKSSVILQLTISRLICQII